MRISRERYGALYGPTVGDRLRLADTDLWLEVEEDRCVGGDEAVFGGGKTIRESMLQGVSLNAPDVVITNVVVLDHWGIVKCDVGIRGGRICALGKAGNPDVMDGVHPELEIGPTTEIIAGEGRILTAGGIDGHVHFICPQIVDEAVAAGMTTLIGGGTGPAEGTRATTCTPSPWAIREMLLAMDEQPVNVLLLGKGNTVSTDGMLQQARAGAGGFKLHEDWGSTPAAIDACLRVADETGVQVAIHTDTLNEAGFVETTLAAIGGRTIHAYHTEGAGGGHAPDIITVAAQPNVLPSSTNPTRPHTVNTVDEHLDMLIVCHHLNPRIPEDLAFAESRIRGTTIAAEDILHDLGAISMIGSDSQAMGRVGETIIRTWQTAHVMAARRGGDGNERLKRYVAKYTINPAIAHGIADEVGSVEVGKLADLVLWDPAYFAIRPRLVLKGGAIAYAPMGDANASIPTPQPVLMRPMFAGSGRLAARRSLTFVSHMAVETLHELGLESRVCAVRETRSVTKASMLHNDACPEIRVDPDTFQVWIDGDEVVQDPATSLPLAQRYSLFSNPLALLLADSRFPSGSYAHSLGLEQAVVDGLTDVPAFIRSRQRLAAAADARFAVEARRAACIPPVYRGQTPVYALYASSRLEPEWCARTPSAVLRESARRLGSQLLRSASKVWDVEVSRLPRPLALGVVAAAAGVSEEETALLALYDDAATVASAALKLLPLDPAVTARWLAELAPAMADAARAIAADDGPLPSPAAVAIELSAPIHLEQRERLFAS